MDSVETFDEAAKRFPASALPYLGLAEVARLEKQAGSAEQMMRHDLLNYHPLENGATTTISAPDLLKFIRSCGHDPKVLALA